MCERQIPCDWKKYDQDAIPFPREIISSEVPLSFLVIQPLGQIQITDCNKASDSNIQGYRTP